MWSGRRPGGAGALGSREVAKAAPDGYTRPAGGGSQLTVLSALSASASYDPAKDFAPVAKFHGDLPDSSRPFVVTVNLGESSHRRPARPSRGAWAHSDTAGLPQLAGELFMTRAGIRIVGVPYRSGGESVTAVLRQAEAEVRLKISLM